MKQRAPFGSWGSLWRAEWIARGMRSLGQLQVHGDYVYWIEGRPDAGGHTTLMRHTLGEGEAQEMAPPSWNIRSRVHEYGGGSYAVGSEAIFLCRDDDQRVYRISHGSAQPITPPPDRPRGLRYADLIVGPDGNAVICVRERHVPHEEPQNDLVWISAERASKPRVLQSGNDFYSSPRLSPDGTQISWLSWDHPNMPWDQTTLWLANISADGQVSNARAIAGASRESICQPEWSPWGVLHFVSDRTGWWNLYAYKDDETVPVVPMEAEFGAPQWVFGTSMYAFLEDRRIACVYIADGVERLGLAQDGSLAVDSIDLPYTSFGQGGELHSDRRHRLAFLGGGPSQASAVICIDLENPNPAVLRSSSTQIIDDAWVSRPRPFTFPTSDGETAHAFFYPPTNPNFEGPPEDPPPLLVVCHGGPTGATTTVLSPRIQFWTSRGFAVADVDYRGSTGYGRPYREALYGRSGIVDVGDCVDCARYLSEAGRVDADKLAIRGGSAGGYIVLAALAFHDVFAAGTSYYGISDLEALVSETHKFESRYPESLVGPYPRDREVYLERSPIHHVEGISCPVFLLQGAEDNVVPLAQAEGMVDALRRRSHPVALMVFKNEGHGFRLAENIVRAHESELSFYAQVFGFQPADSIQPLHVENL